MSVFWVFLVCISPHLDWIWRDTKHLSVFSQDTGKYRPKTLWIRTLFTQWWVSKKKLKFYFVTKKVLYRFLSKLVLCLFILKICFFEFRSLFVEYKLFIFRLRFWRGFVAFLSLKLISDNCAFVLSVWGFVI